MAFASPYSSAGTGPARSEARTSATGRSATGTSAVFPDSTASRSRSSNGAKPQPGGRRLSGISPSGTPNLVKALHPPLPAASPASSGRDAPPPEPPRETGRASPPPPRCPVRRRPARKITSACCSGSLDSSAIANSVAMLSIATCSACGRARECSMGLISSNGARTRMAFAKPNLVEQAAARGREQPRPPGNLVAGEPWQSPDHLNPGLRRDVFGVLCRDHPQVAEQDEGSRPATEPRMLARCRAGRPPAAPRNPRPPHAEYLQTADPRAAKSASISQPAHTGDGTQ